MALLINGQRIDSAALDYEFSNIKAYHERLGNISCCERDDEFRGYARQNIVGRALLIQHAEATLPPISRDEIEAAFEKLKQDHGGEERFYAGIGATPEDAHLIKRDIETNLRVERLIDQACAADLPLTDADLRRFYDENLLTFMTTEEVRASHISKSPPRAEQRDAVFGEFRDIRKQLLAGADFDELARRHSDRGADLIDLGFFSRGQLPEEFELVAFSMNVGEISPVFGSSVGFHIVKVTGHKPAAPRPFDDCRDEVSQRLLDQRRQRKMKELVEQLQATATIEEVPDEETAPA